MYLNENELAQYSTPALAFLGDSVYELWIRNYIVKQGNAPKSALHDKKITFANAGFQAEAADMLSDFFNEKESSVFRRGKNAKERSIPRHSSAVEYKKATGLEAVLGYHYLAGNIKRIDEIMNFIIKIHDKN